MAKRKKPELSPGLVNALKDQGLSVDSGSLLRELIDVWGGPRQLALDLHNEFHAAQPGGQTRQRIMDMLQRLVVNCTNDDLNRPIDPTDLDDAELEALAMGYVERLHTDGKQEKKAGRRRPPAPVVDDVGPEEEEDWPVD